MLRMSGSKAKKEQDGARIILLEESTADVAWPMTGKKYGYHEEGYGQHAWLRKVEVCHCCNLTIMGDGKEKYIGREDLCQGKKKYLKRPVVEDIGNYTIIVCKELDSVFGLSSLFFKKIQCFLDK